MRCSARCCPERAPGRRQASSGSRRRSAPSSARTGRCFSPRCPSASRRSTRARARRRCARSRFRGPPRSSASSPPPTRPTTSTRGYGG
ncbi:MAG: hypothetical protein FJX21_11140 [Alphaproteobacteria bacterium]|nr:hypothetical protein [Alphaproteobacteria bacterium]